MNGQAMIEKSNININYKRGRLCNHCKNEITREALKQEFYICPHCKNHLRIHAKDRISLIADQGRLEEWDHNITFANPLMDMEYDQKLHQTFRKHKLNDAVMTGKIKIGGMPIAVGVMDSRFMMASMGYVVGEKITRLFERALKLGLPVLLFCCSGGARMQEGIISLMQMEKTAMAVKRFHDSGLLYVSVLTNPTMGGVTASFAMLADIILAEPKAMIGFAGPRVIKQTTGATLPKGFQSAEFQLEHGFVDDIVQRADMREYLQRILALNGQINFRQIQARWKGAINRINVISRKSNEISPWERVKIARMKERPASMDYIRHIFRNFIEFHGDRYFGDDKAIIGGIAFFNDLPVTIIAQQKGKASLDEAIYRNYGMPSPEGYRKALRLMKQAERFRRPIICFIDTLGAFCGEGAEERGQGEAIARMLAEMSSIKVPILSVVISEGGSGGALALGIGDEVWMMENAVYSVLTPEGYASILWGSSEKAAEAAMQMKLTAKDLLELNVVEKIIPEPEPLTVKNMKGTCAYLEKEIIKFIDKYNVKRQSLLMKNRYKRFRKF